MKGEKELFHALDRIYDLYIYMFLIMDELYQHADFAIEKNKKKRLPAPEDLNPNKRFVENRVFHQISVNKSLLRQSQSRKIGWTDHHEMVRKMFNQIKETEEYTAYMESDSDTYADDLDFAVKIFKKYVANYEIIHQQFEEESIYWNDDLDLVCSMVIKTMKRFDPETEDGGKLVSLYKDPEDEIQFVKNLFRKTILESEESEAMIREKAENWETERIAVMDMLLMKMAISEVQNFETIPVKVTLNEYIEISKFYSTPKSSVFINGILDKVFDELKATGKIKKMGRGLIV